MKDKQRRVMRMPAGVIFVCFLCICMMSFSVRADEDPERVFDYADLLTEEEEGLLQRRALELEADIQTELYILTISDARGKTSVEYADDFGDEHAFGYEEPYGTYIVFLIDMDNRNAWISTSGNAISYLSERRIDDLLDEVFRYLPDGEYYLCCDAFLEKAAEYMRTEPGNSSSEYDPNQYPDTIYQYDNDANGYERYETREEAITRHLKYLAISLLIGIAGVVILSFQSKTKVTTNSRTYERTGAFCVHRSTDQYLRTTTTKRKIESSTNAGGGGGSSAGGSHTSSGGHSHGGGGRSF